jgi:alanine dehydrogenase
MPTLRIVSEDEVKRLFDEETALRLARDTFADHAAQRNFLSDPVAMMLDASTVGGPRLKFKAGTLARLDVSGIRLLCRFSGNTGGDACNYTAVFDHRQGLVGLVSEIWLSRIRTAAFGVIALEPLVNPGPLTIGLFGSGDIATAMMPLIAKTFEIREVRVASRRMERAQAFADKFRDELKIEITAESESSKVTRDANLVLTITESREPLVQRGQLAPGAVLCSMGNYNEVAYDVLQEIDRIIVDDLEFAATAGDGAAWIKDGRLTRDEFYGRISALSSEAISGKKAGRLSPRDRVLALIQGVATGDIAFADHVLKRANSLGIGQTVELLDR